MIMTYTHKIVFDFDIDAMADRVRDMIFDGVYNVIDNKIDIDLVGDAVYDELVYDCTIAVVDEILDRIAKNHKKVLTELRNCDILTL